ncbi:hypothetical protein [Methanococcoides sp. FTZ1]
MPEDLFAEKWISEAIGLKNRGCCGAEAIDIQFRSGRDLISYPLLYIPV